MAQVGVVGAPCKAPLKASRGQAVPAVPDCYLELLPCRGGAGSLAAIPLRAQGVLDIVRIASPVWTISVPYRYAGE